MVESRKDRNWDEKLKRVEVALKHIGSDKLRPVKSQQEGARSYIPSAIEKLRRHLEEAEEEAPSVTWTDV